MEKPPNVRKPFRVRKHADKRTKQITLFFSESELAQIDKCAQDMQWTRSDVIRNCCANGSQDIQTFVKGCDSPLLKAAWKLALVMSKDAEAERVRELMDQVEETRATRHADLIEPHLYDDDQLATA